MIFLFSRAVISAHAQIITTIAGGGASVVCTSCGDGGPATAAFIYGPWGVCLDLSGTLYVSDAGHSRIRTVDGSGIINNFAGSSDTAFLGDGGPATAAGMRPTDVAADLLGNIYIDDGYHNRVRKVTASGIITTIAGNGVAGYSGDGGPAILAQIEVQCLTTDDAGNLYLSGGNKLRKVDTSGLITAVAGSGISGFSGDGGPALEAQLQNASGITIDDTGNIYVADRGNFRIRKIDKAGTITTIAGTGTWGYTGDGGPATDATFKSAYGLAIDALNNIYVTDQGAHCIRKINTAGIITTIAGTGIGGFSGDGGPATLANIATAGGILVDSVGNIYFSDGNDRVRMIHSNNHMPSFAGGHSLSLSMCEGAASVSLNTLLAASDVDAGQTVQWLLSVAPHHGSAAISYSATATGGTLTPAGLSYSPAAGYWGNDTFTVRVDDGISAYKTTVYVTVSPLHAGAITGDDSVCAGATISLADTTAGGVWTSSNPAVATVSSGGVVSGGTATGTAMISYTLSNSCGTAFTTHPVTVHNGQGCITGMQEFVGMREGLSVSPNPASGEFSVCLGSVYSEQARVVITNVTGTELLTFSTPANKGKFITVDANRFPPGIYFLHAVTSHGVWYERLQVR